eukprot:scaffold3467_cov120-Isochrysis_galbana.AAC.5
MPEWPLHAPAAPQPLATPAASLLTELASQCPSAPPRLLHAAAAASSSASPKARSTASSYGLIPAASIILARALACSIAPTSLGLGAPTAMAGLWAAVMDEASSRGRSTSAAREWAVTMRWMMRRTPEIELELLALFLEPE